MSSWFGRWFGYGMGAAAGNAIFGEETRLRREPIREQTEEEILADEERFDADERRLEADARAERASKKR